jgi:hypothetical protein
MKIVVAANYQEYQKWCWDNGHSAATHRYLDAWHRLRGVAYANIVVLPGWETRKDWREVSDAIHSRRGA